MLHTQFCQNLLAFFENKSKAIVNLVVALASNTNAKSPTELALNPVYKYQYSSICDAIHHIFDDNTPDRNENKKKFEKQLLNLFKIYLPPKQNNKFWLLDNDVTSILREHSPTLKEKEYVYKPNNVVPGNKPVSIGQRLSTIGFPVRIDGISWNLPLSMLRVPTDEKSSSFAAQQLRSILDCKSLFGNDLVVCGSDSGYSKLDFIHPLHEQENLVNIIRIASNRKVWFPFKGEHTKRRGAKSKYGQVCKLNKLETLGTPDTTTDFTTTFSNGRTCMVHLKQWNQLLFRGKAKKIMYDKPFSLISVQITDLETGDLVFKNTLWLTVWGKRSNELTIKDIYDSFRLRYDIEFFFRFGKQKLMLDKFQTPDVNHQENWFHAVQLAYWLLFLCKDIGKNQIHKWEKYNTKYNDKNFKELANQTMKTPTQTQRAMVEIINEFAKKHLIPKTHNKSSGRKKGETQTPREEHKVIKKGKKFKI